MEERYDEDDSISCTLSCATGYETIPNRFLVACRLLWSIGRNAEASNYSWTPNCAQLSAPTRWWWRSLVEEISSKWVENKVVGTIVYGKMRAIWMASTPYTPWNPPNTPRNTQRSGFKAGVCRRSLPPFCTFPYIRAIKRGDGGSAEVDSNTQIHASLWLELILWYFERVLLVADCGGQRHWGCSGWGKDRKRRPSKDHSWERFGKTVKKSYQNESRSGPI